MSIPSRTHRPVNDEQIKTIIMRDFNLSESEAQKYLSGSIKL